MSQADQVISEQLSGARQVEVFKDLHLIPKWNQPGTSGDSGGASGLNHGSFVWQPGVPSKLSVHPVARPQGKPWDTYYFYNSLLTAQSNAEYFSYTMDVTFPTQKDLNVCTAWENELEVCEAGLAYNMAWQCKPSHVDGPPAWRYFVQGGGWKVPTVAIPAPVPVPGTAMTVLSKFFLDRIAKTVTHLSLTINDKEYPVNVTLPAKPKWSAGTFYTHNAFQLDSDGKGSPYTVVLNNVSAVRL